jgi:hypothetical protein
MRVSRARIRKLLLVLIMVLYAVSIPWYRPSGAQPEILWGLPDWVAVGLACYVAAALLNSLAWLVTDVPDQLPPGGDPEP